MEGHDLLFALVPQIHAASGINPMLHVFDTIVPIFDAADMLRLERDLATADGDIAMEWLDHDDILRLEPRINPAVQRGALLRDSAQING